MVNPSETIGISLRRVACDRTPLRLGGHGALAEASLAAVGCDRGLAMGMFEGLENGRTGGE